MLERLKEAIEKEEFNYVETEGFKKEHKLGLLAGAAIGYRVAVDDFQGILGNLQGAGSELADTHKTEG